MRQDDPIPLRRSGTSPQAGPRVRDRPPTRGPVWRTAPRRPPRHPEVTRVSTPGEASRANGGPGPRAKSTRLHWRNGAEGAREMELHFRNNHGSTLWVCIGFYDPGRCGPYGNWGTRGWWNINASGEAYVVNTSNRYAYFYAEAADGGVWAGQYGPVLAPRHALDA